MRTAWTAAAILLLALYGCTENQPAGSSPGAGPAPGFGPGAAGPVEVAVLTLKSGPVARTAELPGRVAASATAELRPQVDGIVRKVLLNEGSAVAAGDLLYELDDRKFQAAVAGSRAALKKAEAAAASAQLAFERNEKLAATNAVSTQTLDDARSTLLQARADEEVARADLQAVQIELDNATIEAPIAGMVGVSSVSIGSLVTANQTTPLATIRQIDPVYVDLVDSSANLLRIRDEVQAGRLGREPGLAPSVVLTLENGKEYALKGELKLADVVVSETSGTFSLRASFANPDRILLPGMFVRAKVDLGSMPGAFLVPQRAVQRSNTGEATLFVVTDDGKAALRTVRTSGALGNDWIVVDGVKDGDRLIVDGFQKISDGSAVTPVEGTIDADGVVRQTVPDATGGNGKPSE